MIDFKPERALLAEGYKQALNGFKQIQTILLSFSKNLNSLDVRTSEVKIAIGYLKNVSDAISNVLTKDSNAEIMNGKLFKLSTFVSRNILDSTIFDQLMGIVGESNINLFLKSIKNGLDSISENIRKGDRVRTKFGDLVQSIKSADWRGLAGGVFTTAARLTPFAPVLESVGGWVYNAWDKANRKSFEGNGGERRFHENLSGIGSSSFGRGNTGFGSSSNAPLGGSSSVVGGLGISNDLLTFYSKDAYKAGWTKEVLDTLKTIAGEKQGSGLFSGFGDIVKTLGQILSVLGKVSAVVGAAFVGWEAGRWLGQNIKWGGKTLDEHTANVEAGGFNLWNKMTGKYNFASKDRQLLDQQRGISGMSAQEMAELNVQLKARTQRTIQNNIKQKDTTVMTIAVLKSLLEESKRTNDLLAKKNTSGAGVDSSKSRVIHKDIGDSTVQLINTGTVGQSSR